MRRMYDAGMGFAACRPPGNAGHRAATLRGLMCPAVFLAACASFADPATTINAMRAEGCAGEPSAAPVERSGALDDVARELSRGLGLKDAIDRVGYPATRSGSLQVTGPTEDAAIRKILEDRYCEIVSNPQFTEVGVYRSGDETWIVLAAGADLPAVEESSKIAARVLELVNAARAEPRRCGSLRVDAAPPLKLSRVLTEAAALHARDMAQHGTLDHRGSDGSQPDERVSRAGYRWRATGENIASGPRDAEAVVAGWLDSPGHCTNIMGPQFTEMGVAFALAASRNPAIYWAQVFAAPR
jgi:uncharacterized protein YkwD